MTKYLQRHYKKVENIVAKRDKLKTLETLILWHEEQPNPDVDCIRDMKRRAVELRTQLKVTSTLV